MRFVILVEEVRKERVQLVGRQHALVDDDLRGQAADVEELALGQTRIGAETVRRILADEVEAAFQRISFDARRGRDEELLHDRHRRASSAADVGAARIDRWRPPAQQLLTGAGDGLRHDALAVGAFCRVPWQEHVADAVTPRRRQFGFHGSSGNLAQELVGKACQDARAVAGVLFVAQTAAVHHAAVHVPRVTYDLVARAALDVADEPDAASVFLEGGVVQPVRSWQSQRELAVQVGHRHRLDFLWGTRKNGRKAPTYQVAGHLPPRGSMLYVIENNQVSPRWNPPIFQRARRQYVTHNESFVDSQG